MGKSSYTNIEIINAIKSNNADKVLVYLYKNLEPKIRGWIVKNNGSKQEAQDIFQDSIVAFYSFVLKNKFDPNSNVEALIFRIAKNNWINYVKKQNKNSSFEENDSCIEEPVFSQDISDKNQKIIADLLDQLGEVCKEILTYTIFYNISMEDVCTRLGFKNPNTAKTKNYKCKQRLKNLLLENPSIKKSLLQ